MLQQYFSKLKAFEPLLWIYYIWYYLPIARTFFRSSTYNYIFFAFFIFAVLLCFVYAIVTVRSVKVDYNLLTPILIYMAVFLLLVLMGTSTAGKHIRISFTFWGTLIVYYLTKPYPDSQKRLSGLFLTMFFVTALTSLIGVIMNPNAARLLAYASNEIEEDLIVRMLNIGGIAFFQGLVVCVPLLITFAKRNRFKIFSLVFICMIFVSLISASFAISLLMFVIAVFFGLLSNAKSYKTVTKFCMGLLVVLLLVFVPWSNVFSFLAEVVPNERISVRFESIAVSLKEGLVGGSLNARWQTYLISINTFLEHPLGIGPHYTYVTMENGIGYHSQILDDLARYGILAIVFYIAFFVGYYKLLCQQWKKIDMKHIAFPVLAVYFLFLCLNPGFTSEHEGVLMLFVIPVLPEMLLNVDANSITGLLLKRRKV